MGEDESKLNISGIRDILILSSTGEAVRSLRAFVETYIQNTAWILLHHLVPIATVMLVRRLLAFTSLVCSQQSHVVFRVCHSLATCNT